MFMLIMDENVLLNMYELETFSQLTHYVTTVY